MKKLLLVVGLFFFFAVNPQSDIGENQGVFTDNESYYNFSFAYQGETHQVLILADPNQLTEETIALVKEKEVERIDRKIEVEK